MTPWVLFYLLMLGVAIALWLQEEGPLEARKRRLEDDEHWRVEFPEPTPDELAELRPDLDDAEPWGARR